MLWQLKKISKGSPSTLYPLSGSRTIIGRSSGSDLVLADSNVSRIHCTLEIRDGQLWIQDEKSRNGTAVNCCAISQPVELQAGDVVRIGPFLFLIMQADDSSQGSVNVQFKPALKTDENETVISMNPVTKQLMPVG